jgi:hypothetical protein
VLVAIVLVIISIGGLTADRVDPTSADARLRSNEAEDLALRFLEGYAAFDAERATASLARDADISLLIRSVGADGVDGTRREFRLFLNLLDAWRYRQAVETCAVTSTLADGTGVRCRFDYDFLGSHALGLGPYTGSSFDLAVQDGEIVFVSKFWAFDRFAREVWDPFAEWVAAEYPNDARRMYDDPDRRGVRLDEASIRRWERHTTEYVRTIRGES